MGANRTTILSIRGLSWSAIPRPIRIVQSRLRKREQEAVETCRDRSHDTHLHRNGSSSLENCRDRSHDTHLLERGLSFPPLTDYNTPCCLTRRYFLAISPRMNDIETLINDSDVEKEIFLRHGRLVYRFSTEEWIYEIEELNLFYKELYYWR